MDSERATDGGTGVDPTDRETLRDHLERFAGEDRVTESADGTLTADFSASTYFTVGADGHVESGMPLHGFDGPADRLRFDYDGGEIRVSADDGAVNYAFRRPSQ